MQHANNVLTYTWLEVCCALQVNVADVDQKLQNLKPARKGAPDPVSKLWPGHYSQDVQQKHAAGVTPLSNASQAGSKSHASKQGGTEKLKQRFPEYFEQYGYE